MFKDHDLCKSNQQIDFTNKNSVSLSDFVRFFVLDQYQGVYTDGDVIYLKDMRLLWDFGNFAYRYISKCNQIKSEEYKILMNLFEKNDAFQMVIHEHYKYSCIRYKS
jgi:mannosyltransferase OCH1-like enzyme